MRHLNLTRREADVALRPSRFEQQDVVQREIAILAFGLYASDSYLAELGVPVFTRHCEGHRMIAMSEALTGVGMTCLPRFLGDATPNLRLLATPSPAPERKLWLGCHREVRAVPRVRATLDFLSAGFGRLRPALRPSA